MKNLGKEHSLSTAQTMNSIGLVYENQSKYKEALEYYEKSLEILSKVSKGHT